MNTLALSDTSDASVASHTLSSTPKPRVIIADDDHQVRNLLRTMIQPIAADVFVAENGKQAVAALQKRDADILLLDLIMPDQEGIETLLWVRKNRPGLAVIVISGQVATYGHMARKLGARAALHKPISRADLTQAIEAAWQSVRCAATLSNQDTQ